MEFALFTAPFHLNLAVLSGLVMGAFSRNRTVMVGFSSISIETGKLQSFHSQSKQMYDNFTVTENLATFSPTLQTL